MEARILSTLQSVVRVLRRRYATFMAGSLAYSSFLSVFSLVVLAFAVAATVGGQSFRTQGMELVKVYLPPTGRRVFSTAVRSAEQSASVSVLSGVVSLWGGIRVFRGMDTAFSEIYGSTGQNSFVDRVRDGLVVFASLVAAVIAASVALSMVVVVLPESTETLVHLFLFGGLFVVFFPIFYVFPDVDVAPREVIPGVAVAAVGWTALQMVFGVYAEYADKIEVFGVVGAVLLMLTWLYLANLLLLVGAAVNAVLSDDVGPQRPASR